PQPLRYWPLAAQLFELPQFDALFPQPLAPGRRRAALYASIWAVQGAIPFCGPHFAHAISAYSYSGFDDAAIVVMDGRGAWEATSIWRGSKGRIEHLQTINWPDSLGLFYARFTEFLGFTPNADEWKVMGLAPYGEPGVNLRAFLEPEASPYKVHTALLMGD